MYIREYSVHVYKKKITSIYEGKWLTPRAPRLDNKRVFSYNYNDFLCAVQGTHV